MRASRAPLARAPVTFQASPIANETNAPRARRPPIAIRTQALNSDIRSSVPNFVASCRPSIASKARTPWLALTGAAPGV
jgi:hypothetical protein